MNLFTKLPGNEMDKSLRPMYSKNIRLVYQCHHSPHRLPGAPDHIGGLVHKDAIIHPPAAHHTIPASPDIGCSKNQLSPAVIQFHIEISRMQIRLRFEQVILSITVWRKGRRKINIT